MHFKTETIVGTFILAAIALFLYMSYQLGSLRLDALQHAYYTLDCKDVAGLTQKADIKIRGVKVGWVDSVALDGDHSVKLGLRILKTCTLRDGMQALIRQEGLLGAKYLELIPSDSPGAVIKAGDKLPITMRQFVSMDELFYSFQKIANQIESVGNASHDIALLAKDLIMDVKKLITRFDRSADIATQSVVATANSLQQAASAMQETLAKAGGQVTHIGELAEKIKGGEGSLGKLINDPRIYEDVKYTSDFAQQCVRRVRGYGLALDTHLEVLPQHCSRTNVKGYFDVWLYPCADVFCLLGPVYSHRGFAKRIEECCNGQWKKYAQEKRDSFRLNLQVGAKLPAQLQIRAGLFQGTAGFGIDWCLPFDCVQWISTFEAFDFRGHTRLDDGHRDAGHCEGKHSGEARCNATHCNTRQCNTDCRPYLKWLNRLYFTDYAYLVFGANDFISKRSRSGFIGVGATFSTCDIWPCRR